MYYFLLNSAGENLQSLNSVSTNLQSLSSVDANLQMDLATKIAMFFIVILIIAILLYFFRPKAKHEKKKKDREKRPKEILLQNLLDFHPQIVSSFELNLFVNEWGIDEVRHQLKLLKKLGHVETKFIRQNGKLRGMGYRLTNSGVDYANKYLKMRENSEV